MFQQDQGESLYDVWNRFKDLLQKVPHHGLDLWLQIQIFYDHVNYTTQMAIDDAARRRLRKLRPEEAWKTIEDLAQYKEEEWSEPSYNLKLLKHIKVYGTAANRFLSVFDILRNYDPMDDEPMWATDHVVALTPGSAITIPETANEFAIKGNHLTLVKGNQFDGRTKTDPHKHIHEFLEICDMFKYRDTKNEAVRLMMFLLSLTGEAKTWLDELNEGTIETWDEFRIDFISRFFPSALFDRLL
ncbi:reverse transcriptase domain-containing protein [Tanacetum coccineum]